MTKRVRIQMLTVIFCLLMIIPATALAEGKTLLMATTTSTDNTGLLDVLGPLFTKDTGIALKWVATGTGKALKLGENCDADILMVHAPASEKAFVDAGFGVDRRQVMYNDFVIIGPVSDPAGIESMPVETALTTVVDKGAIFVSRGDNSGTDKKEKSLWKAAGLPLPDKASWYVQTGQGMLATINVAAERKGYTMTDRGTFIKYEADHQGNPPLVILVEGDGTLLNQYSVIAVNPKRCTNVQNAEAKVFADWITSAPTQKAIGDFKLLGKQLFTPNAK
ncbi:MAG: substrate-binding domain-containing protein [Pseudomonadota bacterium]